MKKVKNVQDQSATPQSDAAENGVTPGSTVVDTDSLIDQVRDLQTQLEQANNQSSEYLDGWQRSRAEFANYKRRVERTKAQAAQLASGAILKRYLPIVDDMERALKNRPQNGDGARWADGIELVYRKMLTLLESEGVKPMQSIGVLFDPNLHEAVMTEDSSQYESGQVTEVLQQGYLIGDKVLRPAMVRVAR